MSLPPFMRGRLRLPSRIALLLGFGALSTAGAHANTAEKLANPPDRMPQQSAKSFGEVRIWIHSGRIYLSEPGGVPQELRLGDTAEARHLRQLLERDEAAAGPPQVLLNRIILVGGGGDGFHWAPPKKDSSAASPASPPASGFAPADARTSGGNIAPAGSGPPARTKASARRETADE